MVKGEGGEVMGHFAKVNADGVVEEVAVAESGEWLEANIGGTWIDANKERSDGKPFAGIGDKFDAGLGAFIPPRPFSSWQLDAQSFGWEPPMPRPQDGEQYLWDEGSQSWVVDEVDEHHDPQIGTLDA